MNKKSVEGHIEVGLCHQALRTEEGLFEIRYPDSSWLNSVTPLIRFNDSVAIRSTMPWRVGTVEESNRAFPFALQGSHPLVWISVEIFTGEVIEQEYALDNSQYQGMVARFDVNFKEYYKYSNSMTCSNWEAFLHKYLVEQFL